VRKSACPTSKRRPTSRRFASPATAFQSTLSRPAPRHGVYIAKVGHIPVEWSRRLPSEPSSVTLIRDRAGRYFTSFVCETVARPLPSTESTAGIDLGLKTFASFSNSKKQDNPRIFRKLERKLKRLQRSLSRKFKGSNNRNKQRLKVARLHAHIADVRTDFLHKLSTKILHENPPCGGQARWWWSKTCV
jgi:putative transposase